MKNANTLHLTLKKRWWDMIERGEKREEYREIKPYWTQRLCRYGKDAPEDGTEKNQCINGGCKLRLLCQHDETVCAKYDYVCFHYGRTARTMLFEIEGIFIGEGKPEWGAPENVKVYIIQLWKRIL